MRITRSPDVPSKPMEAGSFTGRVSGRDLGAIDAPASRTFEVAFEPGARTYWHRHSGGQLLYGLTGAGQVGTRDGETVAIGPGDLVHAPPGEEHWHGASADESLTHLAVSFGETEWFEEVD